SRRASPAGRRSFVFARRPKRPRRQRTSSMCGIVGIAGTRDVAPVILDALKRLEYRGYDSAGIATLVDGQMNRRRSPGNLGKLGKVLQSKPLRGHTGIGHTRWATHGAPTEINAHPHASAKGGIVHSRNLQNFRGPPEVL